MDIKKLKLEELKCKLAIIGGQIAFLMRYENKNSATIVAPSGMKSYKIFIQEVDNEEVTGVTVE